MSPITHFLGSWALAEGSPLDDRDRSLLTWCGVLPDADGIGIAVDLMNRLLGRPETVWYTGLHHHFLHGVIGAALLAVLAAGFAKRRLTVLFGSFIMVHIHLLCDLLGSRARSQRISGRSITSRPYRPSGRCIGPTNGRSTAGQTCWRPCFSSRLRFSERYQLGGRPSASSVKEPILRLPTHFAAAGGS